MRTPPSAFRIMVSLFLSILLGINLSPELALALSRQPFTPDAQGDPVFFSKIQTASAPIQLAASDQDVPGRDGEWKTVIDYGSSTQEQGPENETAPQSPQFTIPMTPGDEPTPESYPDSSSSEEPASAEPEPALQPGEIARKIIGPEGGEISSPDQSIRISVPSGAVRDNTQILILEPDMPVEIGTETAIGPDEFIQAGATRFGPAGTAFDRPVTVTVRLSPQEAARLGAGHELVIAVADGDKTEQKTRYRVNGQGWVEFEMEHFTTPFFFLLAAGSILAFGALFGRMMATDSPNIMIQPHAAQVKKFIADGNLKLPKTINKTGPTDLGINKSFKGSLEYLRVINGGATLVERSDGSNASCQDLSFLSSTLLLASGDPRFKKLIGVGGKASFEGYSGDHMWIEIEIDGKIYAVDTVQAGRIVLLPAAEAYAKYNLKPTFQFGHGVRRKNYIGWDEKPGPDDFSQTSGLAEPEPDNRPETSPQSSASSPNATGEPTESALSDAFKTGDEMGCRHMNAGPDTIKAELREVYGAYNHVKLKESFRAGYAKGQERCRPK